MSQIVEVKVRVNIGDPTGIVNYSNDLYAFKAYKVERGNFSKELSIPGVYFLDGGVRADGKRHIYIGESGNLLVRLRRHNSSPRKLTEWTHALCFTKKEVAEKDRKRIEKRLYEQFVGMNDRFEVYTDKVTAEQFDDDDALKSTLREIKSFLVAMGIDPYSEADKEKKARHYQCKIRNYANKFANGYFSRGKFIVKKGSWVSSETKKNFKPESYWKKRQQLEDMPEGGIKNGRFVRSVEFRSASEAAAVVQGSSANGNDEWFIYDEAGGKVFMKELV